MKNKNIYYLIPDLGRKLPFSFKTLFKQTFKGEVINYLKACLFKFDKPIGGVKVIYQHCMLLRELGFNAKPLLMGKYHGNFFHFDVPTVRFNDVRNKISHSDIIIATEFRPYEGLLFKESTKIMFLQNWMGLTKWLETEDKEKTYLELGYNKVMTCSQFCSNYVEQHMNIPVDTITNGIDLALFKPVDNKRIVNRILVMSRKKPTDLATILNLLKNSIYEIRIVDGLTQNQLINEYQSADIFVATGYPEGFSLPPLEAMACGCVVVGFTGGGGGEFMLHNQTALVANDGDCQAVADMLLALSEDPVKKEKIRLQGIAKASEYSLENTKLVLESYYKKLFKELAVNEVK